MKKLVLFLSISILTLTGQAQTSVSGGIFSNTTWTLAGSPYIITDTVVVFPGITLTIQPGVTVKFADNQQLEIRQAKLIAAGTIAAPITFTSNSVSPTIGIYPGVYLHGGTLISVFDHCNFMYADIAIHAIVGYTLSVKNSAVVSNNFGIQTQYVNIDSCNFKYNNEAMSIWGGVVSDCHITGNQSGMVQLGYPTTVKNCVVDSNLSGITGITGSVLNCIVKYNITGLGCSYPTTINNCLVISNQNGIAVSANDSILNSVVDSNSVFGIGNDGSHYGAGNNTIYNCQIRNNNTGIIETAGQIDLVTKNDIENNTIGILARNNSVYSGPEDLHNIYCNKICNNSFSDLKFTATNNTVIGQNYWCTSDSASTAAVIYDAHDNASYGIVNFMPIYTSVCSSTTTGVHEEATSFSFNIFPNPSSNYLTVEFPETISKVTLQIVNTIGELMYSSTVNQKTDIDVSSFSRGIYFIQISDGKNNGRKKFIKQ